MNVFYRKILIYPKSYSLFIGLLCFATFVQLRLWEWAFYVNFAIFSLCFFAFSKVYLSILEKNIENYQMSFIKRYANGIGASPFHVASKETVQSIVRGTHLIAAFWFVVLPAITLLFHEELFLKTLIFLFLFFYVIATIIRRIAFKLELSLGRSFILVLKSLFLTSIVSFLPLIALITVAF